jgi:hypothetical protein
MQRTGVVNGKGGSYFNAPNAEIVNDVTASITNFRTEGLGNITLTNDIVKFNPEGLKPIQMNFMPSEMSSENTPNGNIRTTKDGYKFIEDATGIKVYKPNGDLIGKYSTAEEAQAKALQSFQKDNPNSKPIPSVDNIRNEPADAPETSAQYTKRKIEDFKQMTDNELENFIDGLKYSDTPLAYVLSETIIPKIIQDFKALKQDNPDPNFTLQHHIANELGNYLFEKQKAFETGKPTSSILHYGWSDNIQHGVNIEKFFNYEYNKENETAYTGKNPTFVSGLSVALDKILPANVNKEGTIQASRLLNLMKSASGGDIGKILTEANSIGFTDWLKSKGQSRIFENSIREYIDNKGIRVSIDPDMHLNADFGDTSNYVAKGKKEGYYTFVARINPEQAHGVEGHFGGDSIVHIRATIRTDAQGRKVLFVEEIQSINTARDELSPSKKLEIKSEIKSIEELGNIALEFSKVSELHFEHKGAMLKRTLDIVREKGIETLKEYEMQKVDEEFKKDFKKLKNIIILSDILNKEKIPNLNILNAMEIMREAKSSIEPYRSFEIKRLISERKSKLAKVKSNKPLQDMPETVKIASRTIMRKAVELGADRVVLVRPEDMNPDVSVNAEGERFVDTLYGRDIPAMMNAELKKYGQKLRTADNISKSKAYKSNTHILLSESLGYDITPEMKQKAGRSQTFMMPSEQAQAWRDFKAERTTEGNSIFKNAMNFVIIQANNKYKVYNPQKVLLGIYIDLDQAKRRVQREEPKQL